MNKPDTRSVVRALEESVKSGLHPDTFLLVQEALPLARLMAEQWDGGEAKAALEWLASHFFSHTDIAALKARTDTPPIVKRFLGKRYLGDKV